MDKHRLYLSAFINVVKARIEDEENKRYIKQNALYGVKLINTLPKAIDYEDLVNRFQLVSAIKETMGLLTPVEFVNVFPIDKDYDGYKYEMKDYFYTIDYMNSLDPDKPIGEEITKLLWEYQNFEITMFAIDAMSLMSDIRRYEQSSLMEEWAIEHGLETHTLHTDEKGKQYLMDKQGKTQKVTKPRPKHLKLVK